ncbi:DNA methyltransferase [Methylovulum sp.]|uniref:DNA methyltransferase n=1 Tax=Methylovulum sp. TaxID=1916980 RepID=UPI0026129AE9|nr:DNA methyltransferase [Methylovulum sp.]MDD5123327.1 DNA methyltransferase [Methylovulum sp.]
MTAISAPLTDMVQLELFDLPVITQSSKQIAVKSARSGTFTDNMKLPVHRWFRYSAGFSAEWAEQLIREYSPSVVLDPFAGSGTTLLAAQAAGAMAYGYESHPFVARIAIAKTHWNQPVRKLLEAKNELLQVARQATFPEMGVMPDLLAKCYTPEVLLQLYALRNAYLACAAHFEPEVAQLLWLALTAILRSCSFVGTAQWQYILPNKRKSKSLDPFMAFEQKITEMMADMDVLRNSIHCSEAVLLVHDARAVPDEVAIDSVDLVVTSPPYPNNYDYADATRLEMSFWGEITGWCDLQEIVRQYIIRSCSQHATAEKLKMETLLADPAIEAIRDELSAVCYELSEIRLTKGGRKAYHTMIAAYFCDLSKVFQALRPVCKLGSTLCFVIGDSAPYGIYVPVDDWLGRLAVDAGFKSFSFEKLRDRNIKWKNRKHRVPLHEGRLWIKG